MIGINQIIWNQMNILREKTCSDPQEYLQLCKECIECNDIRFRIKNKINLISDSFLREQKSYTLHRLAISIEQKVESNSILLQYIRILSFLYDQLLIHSLYDIQIVLQTFQQDPTILFIDNLTDNPQVTWIKVTESHFPIQNPLFYQLIEMMQLMSKR